jgi:hypothetical protein
MKQFIELPESKIIINLKKIALIKIKFEKTDEWQVIMFNHTAMGTNNIYVKQKDYDFLKSVLLS